MAIAIFLPLTSFLAPLARRRRFPAPFAAATAAASSSSRSPLEFDITFAPSSPAPAPSPSSDRNHVPFSAPWVLRGDDGSPIVSSTPPPGFLGYMALADERAGKLKTKTKKKEPQQQQLKKQSGSRLPTSPPRYSKAVRRFYNTNIKEKESPQRLSKVLATAGVASRRSSEELIFQGKVTVNGSVCTTPQTRVDLSKDSIYVNGSRLSKKLPPKLYFALNKPKGYICSCGEEPKSVVSLFDDYFNKLKPGIPKPRLFTVGRLDVNTAGLIIVTNDGDFAQRLSHPSSRVTKEYIAAIDGEVHKRHLLAISNGTDIEGVKCVPDWVELLPTQPGIIRPRLRIVVHDGRNHEVRELIQNAGLQVFSLKRVRIGGFRLPSDLGIGKYVILRDADLKSLGGK